MTKKHEYFLGKLDRNGEKVGPRNCAAYLTWELDEESGRFSMCGHVWNHIKTDHTMGGQCVDTLAAAFPGNKKVQRMAAIWERWHLNDMNAACEHQRALGWLEKAGVKVTLYHFRLNGETSKRQDEIKKDSMRQLQTGVMVQLDAEEQEILALEYSLTRHEEALPASLAPYYEPKRSLYSGDQGAEETKALGWLNPEEHPEGILCRPCPDCGYEYGSEWRKEELPADVIKEIKSWDAGKVAV